MKQLLMILVATGMLNACGSLKKMNVVGNTTDEHGCQITAGYTWSELNKDCIRLFEKAQCIGSMKEGSALLNVYVVFSDDHTKAELFMPTAKANPILKLDQHQWQGKGFVLTRTANRYHLTHEGKEIPLQ